MSKHLGEREVKKRRGTGRRGWSCLVCSSSLCPGLKPAREREQGRRAGKERGREGELAEKPASYLMQYSVCVCVHNCACLCV